MESSFHKAPSRAKSRSALPILSSARLEPSHGHGNGLDPNAARLIEKKVYGGKLSAGIRAHAVPSKLELETSTSATRHIDIPQVGSKLQLGDADTKRLRGVKIRSTSDAKRSTPPETKCIKHPQLKRFDTTTKLLTKNSSHTTSDNVSLFKVVNRRQLKVASPAKQSASVPLMTRLQPSSHSSTKSSLSRKHYLPNKNGNTSDRDQDEGNPNEHLSSVSDAVSNSISSSNWRRCDLNNTNVTSELTQLAVIHLTSIKTEKLWRGSAQSAYQTRFSDLKGQLQDIQEMSHDQQMLNNQLALVKWSCSISPSIATGERLRSLSKTMMDVDSLCHFDANLNIDEHGKSNCADPRKYSRIVSLFEAWWNLVTEIRAGRTSILDTPASRELLKTKSKCIDGLGDGWKAEALVVERELSYLQRDLTTFGPVERESSLGKLLCLLKGMLQNMMEELDLMQWIEAQVLIEEEAHVCNLAALVTANIEQAL